MTNLEDLRTQPLPCVDGYRVCALLGRGGMGIVYAATDEATGRLAAVKLLPCGAGTPAAIARFDLECRILARFDHPHIARLLRRGKTSDGLPWFAMEYVEGQAITDYCDTHHLRLRARLKLLHQVCLAVAAAHKLDVVHRDLKPANILVSPIGEPKLLDFGIAKLMDETSQELTATGCRLLTPRYASTEQLRGGAVSAASDVYSLGVILQDLSEGGGVSSDGRLYSIIRKATAERPNDRYQSAAQLADDIEAYLEGRAVSARSCIRGRVPAMVTSAALFVALAVSADFPAERARASSPADREYLVARHLWSKLAPADLLKAEVRLRRVVQADPESALARAGLADVLYFRGELGSLPPRAAFAEARTEAEKSIQLDGRQPLAHVALAGALHAGELNWDEAERSLKRALELDPNCVRALQGYGCFLMRAGRFEEAREAIRRARALDPASPILGVLEGRLSYYRREYSRAVEELRAVVDCEPGFRLAHKYLGLAYAYLGKAEMAEQEMRLAGFSGEALAQQVAWIRAVNGDRRLADELIRGSVRDPALVFAAAESGEKDLAFAMLESALAQRSPVVLSLQADPRFDPLREDARFHLLWQRVMHGAVQQDRNDHPVLLLARSLRLHD